MPKHITIGDITIEPHYLTMVVFSLGKVGVHFYGVAPEEEGRKIAKKLNELSKERTLKFAAEDFQGIQLTGLCNLINLKIEEDKSQTPILVRFAGSLEWVT